VDWIGNRRFEWVAENCHRLRKVDANAWTGSMLLFWHPIRTPPV
jgi:hypothetical protein